MINDKRAEEKEDEQQSKKKKKKEKKPHSSVLLQGGFHVPSGSLASAGDGFVWNHLTHPNLLIWTVMKSLKLTRMSFLFVFFFFAFAQPKSTVIGWQLFGNSGYFPHFQQCPSMWFVHFITHNTTPHNSIPSHCAWHFFAINLITFTIFHAWRFGIL